MLLGVYSKGECESILARQQRALDIHIGQKFRLRGRNFKVFEKYPPKYVFVSSSRLQCAKNGDFVRYGKGVNTAVAYAWYIWIKGYTGETVVRWIN